MSAPFKFTVTVSGMDLDAWAIDYGIDRDKAERTSRSSLSTRSKAAWTSCCTAWVTTTRRSRSRWKPEPAQHN